MKLLKLEMKNCKPCAEVKAYLSSQNIEPESIDVAEHPEMAVRYKISSVPVTILLDDNENEISRVVGFSRERLASLVQLLM